jgi:hypothetical protein
MKRMVVGGLGVIGVTACIVDRHCKTSLSTALDKVSGGYQLGVRGGKVINLSIYI